MTACVNRKHTKKVAAVVTASLVGALSLGAAPVAAIAEDTGIDMQADAQANLNGGTVSYKGGEAGAEFDYTGYYVGLIPDSLTLVDGTVVESDEFYTYYVKVDDSVSYEPFGGVDYKDEKGNIKDLHGYIESGRPVQPGTYAVVISYNGMYKSIADTFTVNAPSLDDAIIYDGNDQTDTTFEYTGEKDSAQVQNWVKRINVSLGGEKLVKDLDADADNPAEYELQVWKKGASSSLADGTTLVPGTTYIVKVNGRGAYAGESAEKEFVFGKLNLSDAVIAGKIVTTQPTDAFGPADIIDSVNGIDNLANKVVSPTGTELTATFASDPDGNQTSGGKKGVYTYTLSAKDDADYIEGSASVDVVYANSIATVDFSKCGDASCFDGDEYVVDLAGSTKYFDASKVAFKDAAGNDIDADADDYTVTVTDDEGNAATLDDLKTPGTWFVKVELMQWSNDNKDLVAGAGVQKVVVSYDSIKQVDDIFFIFDGENVDSYTSETYSGENFADKMAIKVLANGNELVAGTDYTVTYEKQNEDSSWSEVEEIVNAGDYRITVKGITFEETGTFYFDVLKASLNAFPAYDLVTNDTLKPGQYDGYFTYTGETLTPSFKFADANGNEVVLTADDYTVEYTGFASEDGKVTTTDVDEVKAAGIYGYTVEVSDDVENYASRAQTGIFLVTTRGIYLDVPTSGEWYSQVVYDASKLGYMKGYSGQKIFGVGDSIKRGDVACVLYNMAGGDDAYSNDQFHYTEDEGFETGFDDVNGKLYYAKAIAWAKATGVVNGYAGTNDFRPEAPVSAEEFCAMLANYAKAMGDDVDGADLSVLDSMSDGDQVSDWAKQSVAWAVENEVMGNGGFVAPHEEIARERVAAMAVNYQPEGASDMVIPL